MKTLKEKVTEMYFAFRDSGNILISFFAAIGFTVFTVIGAVFALIVIGITLIALVPFIVTAAFYFIAILIIITLFVFLTSS